MRIYNFVIAPNVVDKKKLIAFHQQLNLNASEKIILFVGRIGYIKGCDTLVEAFKILRSKIVNTRLLLVGNLENDCHNLLNSTKGKIVCCFPPTEKIELFYSVSDVVVLPSREDPFPYVMLEAGLHHKPFIGGNTGGIKEFVENTKEGLLVGPGNVEELAYAMEYMLIHEKEARIMGDNLFQKVSQLTNKDEYVTHLMDIYKQLLVN